MCFNIMPRKTLRWIQNEKLENCQRDKTPTRVPTTNSRNELAKTRVALKKNKLVQIYVTTLNARHCFIIIYFVNKILALISKSQLHGNHAEAPTWPVAISNNATPRLQKSDVGPWP